VRRRFSPADRHLPQPLADQVSNPRSRGERPFQSTARTQRSRPRGRRGARARADGPRPSR
jgi:hypothetical protein